MLVVRGSNQAYKSIVNKNIPREFHEPSSPHSTQKPYRRKDTYHIISVSPRVYFNLYLAVHSDHVRSRGDCLNLFPWREDCQVPVAEKLYKVYG